MSTSPILLAPEGCEDCGRPRLLYARTVIGLLCSDCYKRKGCPLGANLGTLHELEEATRKEMLARGGADAHLVMKGLT